jgi:hypothetical protein
MQEVAKVQFGTFVVLSSGKWGLIERFLETVVARSRDLYVAAERDVEAWVGSLLPPVEAQVREQRAQLIRRAESVQKIRDAQESLDGRIAELERALGTAQEKVEALKLQLGRVRALGRGAELQLAGAIAAEIPAVQWPMTGAEEPALARRRVSA